MAETMYHQQTSAVGAAAFESLLHTLDPISLLLSHNPVPQSEPEHMERGPRYNAYAELRESKLRSKYLQLSPDQDQLEQERESKPTPVKKQVKFNVTVPSNNVPRRKVSASSSVVAQSVPDFSAVLRREKENRRPATRLEMTPPGSKINYYGGVLSSSRGSKSASAGEKNRGNGGLMSRKSYANLEELKGLSSIAASAINCGGSDIRAGGRIGRATTAKNVLGYRHF
ncbi:uncharacterized protein LOC126799865 [Argentina anserina]|uniref:uncharacterized protein LOC126799865 n=1 Tax=Argentina anserina TaxID=57926 RepID=UPI0021763A86|nr:uncharacterized protein LOC126799865 [Potentilla anserina]